MRKPLLQLLSWRHGEEKNKPTAVHTRNTHGNVDMRQDLVPRIPPSTQQVQKKQNTRRGSCTNNKKQNAFHALPAFGRLLRLDCRPPHEACALRHFFFFQLSPKCFRSEELFFRNAISVLYKGNAPISSPLPETEISPLSLPQSKPSLL